LSAPVATVCASVAQAPPVPLEPEGAAVLATTPSATLLGAEGRPVTVEVFVGKGLPSFTMVGLPDTSCREARDRVRAALQCAGLEFPVRRITVNLAPSGQRKAGSGLDLPIAIALLVASEQLPPEAIEGLGFVGELGLDGTIRPVAGMVPLVAAIEAPVAVVPAAAATEATVVGRHEVRPVRSLRELVDALIGDAPWPPPPPAEEWQPEPPGPDLADVRGQAVARYALEVAAAGGHHLLMVGPPGAGKTMLAERMPGLLPDLDADDSLQVTCIHSAAGLRLPTGGLIRRPPLRAPHHGASSVALIGGGTHAMRPGEISMAHRGVLFLDELGEFPTAVLESLRQPLEEGIVRVARARATVTFPARFLLVAAMNPCPCGDGGAPGACRCSDTARARYSRRLSAPLLDRFDLRIHLSRPDVRQLLGAEAAEASSSVGERVHRVRALAADRGITANAHIRPHQLDEVAPLSVAATKVLEAALIANRLSARGMVRVRCVARTVADLAGAGDVLEAEHVSIALGLRADPPATNLRLAG
jgi:magnesium chelatase family protein